MPLDINYSSVSTLLLAFTLGSIILVANRRRSHALPWPPGPRGIPLIGSWFYMPSQKPQITYAKWSRDYQSDLVSVNAFGQPILIINSQKCAEALLEERSSIYSDRPSFTIVNLTGWDWFVGTLPYSDLWRARRRILQRELHENAILEYRPKQHTMVESLIKWLYKDPKDFKHYTYTAVASLSLSLAYGYEVKPRDDPLVEKLERASKIVIDLMLPGTSALNEIPLLNQLPSWFPGFGYKKRAKACRILTHEVLHSPLDTVKQSVADGTASLSLASVLLRDNDAQDANERRNEEAVIRESVASIYSAGADATGGSLHHAIHTLVLKPDAQKQAQAEIDRVVGRDRLPSFDDRDALPYLGAVVREIMRWNNVGPLGIPHKNTQDDVYEGYFIPKGSFLFPNIWAMIHDPERYPDPMTFKPERFLQADGSLNDDDMRAIFGFGRRVCPGRFIAVSTIWLAIAGMLAVFDFGLAKDAEGNDIPVENITTDGTSSRPAPFQCSIKPRDSLAEALIQSLA
ncbi:cytochrome P450 [Dentipellis sp. KUC8613]|nr:cytochrome P450 [Dentipellis sp. KUC8613]